MSVNRVILIGRLGKDPEIKYGASAFCTFSLATTEKWTDKNSREEKKETEWHNCIAFGKTAELIHTYTKKGSQVYVEGRIKSSTKDDKKFYNIQVSLVQFLDSKQDNGQLEEKK